jgi:hypothetical protein
VQPLIEGRLQQLFGVRVSVSIDYMYKLVITLSVVQPLIEGRLQQLFGVRVSVSIDYMYKLVITLSVVQPLIEWRLQQLFGVRVSVSIVHVYKLVGLRVSVSIDYMYRLVGVHVSVSIFHVYTLVKQISIEFTRPEIEGGPWRRFAMPFGPNLQNNKRRNVQRRKATAKRLRGPPSRFQDGWTQTQIAL